MMQNQLQDELQKQTDNLAEQNRNLSGNVSEKVSGTAGHNRGSGYKKQRITTRQMAVSGMLGAVAIVLSVTGLGMIPMPSLAGRATIMHVPVILAAVLEGPVVGAFTGFIFGLYSFMTPVGAIPADPVVRILPRILIGVTAYYTYVLFRRSRAGVAAAAVIGTLTNTIGYLGLASFIGYLPWAASLTVMLIQMPFEMILAVALLLVLDKAFIRRG
ncbi:MAG: ECF transporter S component [Peptococcaceae bacterium]|nr:ECF transporter S component [Peptococcaceae bacterium]